MPQYKFILFKDGKPWKGMFNEVDFINEYDNVYQEIYRKTDGKITSLELVEELAITSFFKRFQPAIWESKRYRSLFKEYVKGANEDEASVIYGIDWDTLDAKEKAIFEFCDEQFSSLLEKLNELKKFEKPTFGVSRGTGALSKL